MDIKQYLIKNNSDMDPMHDSYATEIRIEDKYLIVIYEDLDKGVLDPEGNPYYKNKKLVIILKKCYNNMCKFFKKRKQLWLLI